MTIKLYDYKVINADDKEIDIISAQNQRMASIKLALKYGTNKYFLKLEHAGTRYIEI